MRAQKLDVFGITRGATIRVSDFLQLEKIVRSSHFELPGMDGDASSTLRQVGGLQRKVEEQVDTQARRRRVEMGAGWRIQPKTNRGDARIVDRRHDFAESSKPRYQFEPAIVEQRHEGIQSVSWSGYQEVEVLCDAARAERYERHTTHEDRVEAKPA